MPRKEKPLPRPPSTNAPTIQRARALWDYLAIEDNELSFKAGDLIEIVDLCNQDWYEGRLSGGAPTTGYFPANRVELLKENMRPTPPEKDTPRPPSIAEPSPAAASSPMAKDDPFSDSKVIPDKDLPAIPTASTIHDLSSAVMNLDSERGMNHVGPNDEAENRGAETTDDSQNGTLRDPTGDLMIDLAKVLDEFDAGTASDSSISKSLSADLLAFPSRKTSETVNGPISLPTATSSTSSRASIPERASSFSDSPTPSSVPPPPPPPPVMKFPPPSEDNIDPDLRAISQISTIPPEIIRREGYLSTKLKKPPQSTSKKPPPNTSWAHYWATLTVGFLILFKDNPSKAAIKRPASVLRLNSVEVEDVGKEATKKKGAFRVVMENGAIWLMLPGKEGEMWEWMDAIREASRERSTPAEYENATSKLFAAAPTAIPTDLSATSRPSSPNPDATPSTSKQPRSRRPTGNSRSATDLDDITPEGRKSNVKNKLGAFFSKRPTMDKLKEKGILKDADAVIVFGGRLEDGLAAGKAKDEGPTSGEGQEEKKLVPEVVRLCVEEVDKRGLDSQGIYRLSGNASTIQKMKMQFNQREPVDLSSEPDINVISSLLKLYFRELQDPLIPFSFYDRFIAAAKVQDYDERLIELKTLIQSLPRMNYDTLEYLMRHLSRVSESSDENKMEPSNLAIVFGPTLMRMADGGGNSAYDGMMNMTWQNGVIEGVLVQVEWVFDGSTE